MSPLISRFRAELIDAPIDINLSTVTVAGTVLKVRTRLGGIRTVFILLFGFPCLYFLSATIANPSGMNVILAIVICPVLALMVALFGFTVAEKTFDLSRRLAIRSIIVGKYQFKREEPLPNTGTIQISTRWVPGGSKSRGHREFSATVDPLAGFGFVTANDYTTAIRFGEKLAGFLSYELENAVPTAQTPSSSA